MSKQRGKWVGIHGSLLTEKAYGTCSICHRQSLLITEAYYLSLDVTGLERCPNCNSEMEFYFENFERGENRQ